MKFTNRLTSVTAGFNCVSFPPDWHFRFAVHCDRVVTHSSSVIGRVGAWDGFFCSQFRIRANVIHVGIRFMSASLSIMWANLTFLSSHCHLWNGICAMLLLLSRIRGQKNFIHNESKWFYTVLKKKKTATVLKSICNLEPRARLIMRRMLSEKWKIVMLSL